MSEIGTLEEYTTNSRRYFKGIIHTLGHDLSVRFVTTAPDADKEEENQPLDYNKPRLNPNFPNYYIFALDPYGKEVKVGVAWLKVPKNPQSKIREFLSIMIDDPTLPAPLNATAFPKEINLWSVTWRRRQATA
jgi:uncharacterized protein (DUF736 family)